MASQKQQYTILYGRLSQEDERTGESNSIQHQRDLLEKYARDKGFENTLFLADDGYSGTNFDRPSWKKIIEMIEAGEVSMGFASVPAERREKRQRVLNAAQIRCGERILVQMAQHPAIGFAEPCVHGRLEEIV